MSSFIAPGTPDLSNHGGWLLTDGLSVGEVHPDIESVTLDPDDEIVDFWEGKAKVEVAPMTVIVTVSVVQV